jgi:hypothetical protein
MGMSRATARVPKACHVRRRAQLESRAVRTAPTAPVDRTVDHDNVAQIHGRHQRLGIDIRIDACAERFFISAQPGKEHAGAMETVCGIERHQLPP